MAAASNLNLYLLAVSTLCTFPFLIPLSESQIAPSTEDDSGNQPQIRTSSICDHTIFSFLPPEYRNQRGFQCSHAGDSVYFRFKQDNDNVTTVILSRDKFSGWMGFGFSKDGGMVGSTAVVGWTGQPKDGKEPKVQPGIAKFFLQGKDTDNVIPFKGGELMNFTDTPPFVITNDNLFYMGFQAKFKARLGQQYVILAMGSIQPSVASNNSDVWLTAHTNHAVMQVDFSSGYEDSGTDGHEEGVQKMMSHGILGVVGWGAVLPFGAIIPRYFRGNGGPQWFFLHISVQIVGFLLGLSTVFLGSRLYDQLLPERKPSLEAHRPIGIVAFSLTILQVMALVLRPHKTSEWRKYWNWYHHWVGRLAILLGSMNIVIGLSVAEAGSAWKIGYGFVSTFFLLTVACLEASLGPRKSRKSETASVFGND